MIYCLFFLLVAFVPLMMFDVAAEIIQAVAEELLGVK